MKDIRILRLTLDHFKGQRHFSLNLNGNCCTVYGNNGAGKTTIYDALTWLLFGKDSAGGTRFEIKPHDQSGEIRDHQAITSVEAVLSRGGEAPLTLRRTYFEKRTSRRGAGEVFDGHGSEFFVDGVPVKKFAFEEAVAALADENLFRVLTNVTWFCQGMNWRDRRAVLFELTQAEDDRTLMESRAEFQPLLAAVGRLALDDYRKKLQAERRSLTGLRNDVPVRLDECKKSVEALQGLDFEALGRERENFAARLEEVRGDLARLGHGALLENRRNELRGLELARQALERENEDHRRRQKEGQAEIQRLTWELTHWEAAVRSREERLSVQRQEAVRLEEVLEGLRARWRSVNASSFWGENCPTCGRALEGGLLAEAERRFQEDRARALSDILADSDGKKAALASLRLTISQGEDEARQEQAGMEALRAKLADIRPEEVSDLPDYGARRSALEESVRQAAEAVRSLEEDGAEARTVLGRTAEDLESRVRALDQAIAKRAVLEAARERMEALRRQAADTEARLEAADAMAYLLERFVSFKAARTEERVNSLFETVRWRLFETHVNGGLAECCEATVDGTAYSSSLNNGARVNAGMEVIDVLSRHYGVRVPLVVDNAEGVTELRTMDCQVIRLEVSKDDPALRVEMEA